MLTPQEVSERAFPKASFGGYNMALVDEFLDQVTADYTALFKENAILKGKMKVLVDKVEEYRATEDAMRQTLLSAQRMADNMVAEAETKRVSLLQEAEDAARSKLERLREEYDHTQYRLETAQQNTAASVTRMREILTQQLGCLDELDTLTAPAVPPDFVGDAVREIEWSMTQEKEGDGQEEAESLEETLVSAGDFAAASAEIPSGSVEEEEPKPAEAEAELEAEEYDDSAPTRTFSSEETEALLERIAKVEEETSEEARGATGRIDFDNLAFGENYEN
jgi:DivIVA domain